MQAFVASLTAILLFIHTVFGCCWHHAHVCDHGSMVAAISMAKCCHDPQHDGDSKQQEKPCGCKIECEGTCNYVVPQKVKVDAPQWITVDLLAAPPSVATQRVEAAAPWQALSSVPELAPTLRTHLLHQVFLI